MKKKEKEPIGFKEIIVKEWDFDDEDIITHDETLEFVVKEYTIKVLIVPETPREILIRGLNNILMSIEKESELSKLKSKLKNSKK